MSKKELLGQKQVLILPGIRVPGTVRILSE